jgi:hydroxyethylthiazole kinase
MVGRSNSIDVDRKPIMTLATSHPVPSSALWDQVIRRTWPHPELREDMAAFHRAVPLTHCHTNSIAAELMANVLLALGASPAMIASREEVVEFAGIASGVLINLASVTEVKADSLRQSAAAAQKAGTPWVLDPVAIGVLSFRTRLAHELLGYRPAVIKGNASEILTLAGLEGRAKGVDSTLPTVDALACAIQLAQSTGAVMVITGAVDYVTDGKQIIEIPGGHPVMARVTGTGCALGGVIAAFLGVAPSPLRAATAAVAIFDVAGEQAGRETSGPGSFVGRFLDLLSSIGSESEPGFHFQPLPT